MWTIEYFNHSVKDDVLGLPDGIRTNFNHVTELLIETGPANLPPKLRRHLAGSVWELRFKGREGIARAAYIAVQNKKVVILCMFIKKSAKTPKKELELAIRRAAMIKTMYLV